MLYTPRDLETDIVRFWKDTTPPFNVLLLYGARQVGKSTLLEHLYPPSEHLHINLAREAGFAAAIDQTTAFDDFTFLLQSHFRFTPGEKPSRVLIIDEAQLSHKLGGYVRFMKESWPPQKVILTGSTLSTLFKNHEKPTGRVSEFVLRPFHFREFLTCLGETAAVSALDNWTPEKPLSEAVHVRLLELLETYMMVGGLPEAIDAYLTKKDFLKKLADIYAFYQRDFQHAVDERWNFIYGTIMLRLAASAGDAISLSSIIEASQPGYKQLPSLLHLLEDWHQILRVDGEIHKLSKVGTQTPKRYIFDLGIRHLQNPARFSQLRLQDSAFVKREDVGGIVETFVATELFSLGSPVSPRSWSFSHQSGNIDFVHLAGRQPIAIEVKSALKLNQKHLMGLISWQRHYPDGKLALTNLSRGGRQEVSQDGVKYNVDVVPLYALRGYLSSKKWNS
jgi:predicted AAA+ superfamily ATPase